MSWQAGGWVFKQGDAGEGFFIVLSGEALVLKSESADGPKEQVAAAHMPSIACRSLLHLSRLPLTLLPPHVSQEVRAAV